MDTKTSPPKSPIARHKVRPRVDPVESLYARIHEICPGARIETADPTGEIVVYTGLRFNAFTAPTPIED